MWWAEQSSYRNAFAVAESIASFQDYFDGEAARSSSRPDWLRGVGAMPLHRSQQWATIVYLDRSLDPRRPPSKEPLGAVFSALYNMLGPTEGRYSEMELEDVLDGRSPPRDVVPYLDVPSRLVGLVRSSRNRSADQTRFMLPFSSDEEFMWQRLLMQLDVTLPGPTVAYFIGRVKPIAFRIKSLHSQSFGSLGCIVEEAGGDRLCTTAGHVVEPRQLIRVRRARSWPHWSNRATVREHHAPSLNKNSVDIALLDADVPSDGDSHVLTPMHGSAIEGQSVRAQYSGASLQDRTMKVFATTMPVLDDSGTCRWIGYIANTGDRRRVAAGGDSGSAVVNVERGELVGHLVASTHSYGGIVQSAQHELDGLHVAGPLTIRMPKEWLT